MTTLASLLLLLALPSSAQQPKRARCPDGREPALTGHPFFPLSCEKTQGPDVDLSTAMAKPKKPLSSVPDLDGKWHGLTVFGTNRYEVWLEVTGGRRAVWTVMDYATHVRHVLVGELKKPGWFSGGAPKLTVSELEVPDRSVSAEVRLAPGMAAWKLAGRPEAHLVKYAVSGEHLSAQYVDFDPRLGPIGARVELDRER